MLVNNGDLPKPEQNVLSQQLNTHSQMIPKGALNVSNVQSPPPPSSSSSSSSTKDSNQKKQQQQEQSRIDHHHHHSELNELLTIEDMKECITGVISSSRRAAYNNNNKSNNNSNNIIINSSSNINSNQSRSINNNNNNSSNSNNGRVVSVKREFDADSNNYFNPDFKEGDDEVDNDDYLLDPSLEQIAKRFKY
jgi:hypothetical protein